ncbi:hypothetical protein AH06_138 [Erwinia phage AH06]|nr:hypothetical protein AH06_138 [Erwinia phage AH06]
MLNKIISDNVGRVSVKIWDNCEDYLLRITQGIKRDIMREIKTHGGRNHFRIVVRNSLGYNKVEGVFHDLQVVVTCTRNTNEMKETVRLPVSKDNPLAIVQGTLMHAAIKANTVRTYTSVNVQADAVRSSLKAQLDDILKTHSSVISIHQHKSGHPEIVAEFIQTDGPSIAALFDKLAQHNSMGGLSTQPSM